MGIFDQTTDIYKLKQQLKDLQEQFTDFSYNTLQAVQSILKKNWATDAQKEGLYGLHIGVCVDTKDPFAQGRIRVYHPALVKRKETAIKSLHWAWPISVLGGFDDSGCLWVPPAGSAVCLLFENGNRNSMYYFGTTWNRDRNVPPHNWGFGIQEYFDVHSGHRKGYLVGPNDESQVLPPNNTEAYGISDYNDLAKFEQDPRFNEATPAHLHVIKTAQKHRIKMEDGNPECHHRWKRLEIGSSCGNIFMMLDDHLHRAGQWAHPGCCSTGNQTCIPTEPGEPGFIEGSRGIGSEGEAVPCDDEHPTSCESDKQVCINDLYKQESECRAHRGPGTPENNKCELLQTGMFMSSISGQVFVMDDEVSQPSGVPEWERSCRPFDFGCENRFTGRMFMRSMSGHLVQLSDVEDIPMNRAGSYTRPDIDETQIPEEFNGIRLLTAAGNRLDLNDHTLPGNPATAGKKRGCYLQSTSNHILEMVDYTNEQSSPPRSSGGIPTAKAKEAYVKLRTGYGLQLLMRDDHDQENTETQFNELLAPQKDNDRGPHILLQQESAGGPGLVYLRAGGIFFGDSYDEWVEVVGVPGKNPANRIIFTTENQVHITEEADVYLSDIELHMADQVILLGAGQDCPTNTGDQGPCFLPVAAWTSNGLVMSDRVFVSASQKAQAENCLNPANGWVPCQD